MCYDGERETVLENGSPSPPRAPPLLSQNFYQVNVLPRNTPKRRAAGPSPGGMCGLGVSCFPFGRSLAYGFGPASGPGRLPARGQGIRGLGDPLPPTTPNPALGQPLLAGSESLQAYPVPLSAARHRPSPFRCPAGGTSVRAASELPRLRRGDLLRAMTRLRCRAGWRAAHEAEEGTLLQVGARGCPLLSHGNGWRARVMATGGYPFLFKFWLRCGRGTPWVSRRPA